MLFSGNHIINTTEIDTEDHLVQRDHLAKTIKVNGIKGHAQDQETIDPEGQDPEVEDLDLAKEDLEMVKTTDLDHESLLGDLKIDILVNDLEGEGQVRDIEAKGQGQEVDIHGHMKDVLAHQGIIEVFLNLGQDLGQGLEDHLFHRHLPLQDRDQVQGRQGLSQGNKEKQFLHSFVIIVMKV